MGWKQPTVKIQTIDSGLEIKRQSAEDKTIAIAGNPNVGKSTVFNALTGLKQHTGNWPGKTVCNAQGYCLGCRHSYVLVDIPGTYSLMAHSAEEEVARNFICFGQPDAVVVVCDATCLERNLNLVLQTMEISSRVIVCVNLMDEARRKGIVVNLNRLSQRLGVSVVGTVAHRKETLTELINELDRIMDAPAGDTLALAYPQPVEAAAQCLQGPLEQKIGDHINARWLSVRLLDADPSLLNEINAYLGKDISQDAEIKSTLEQAHDLLHKAGMDGNALKDAIVSSIMQEAESIYRECVTLPTQGGYSAGDRRLDRILTGRATGYPIMILLLILVFWLTISGANIPSEMLANSLFWLQNRLSQFFMAIGAPLWLHGLLVEGVYRVLAWVVSVMLPPMAIFFPLFTLLEDVGYLPRIAYNLDHCFKKCSACGKQALCMCSVFFRISSRA